MYKECWAADSFLAVLFSSLVSVPVLAAHWDPAGEETLFAQFGINANSLSVELQPEIGKKLNYQPNVGGKLWYGLSYGDVGVSLGFSQYATSERDAMYGASRSTDFQFHFYLTKIILEAYYQSYEGYYLQNQGDVDPSHTANQPFFHIPSFETRHLGAGITYVLNKDEFSAAAAFSQTSRQLRSGGSWLVNSSLTDHKLTTNQSLIPSFLSGQYGKVEDLRSAYLTSLSVGGGYAHIFTYANYYFSALLMVNLCQQYQKIGYTTNSEEGWVGNTQSGTKISVGYNGEKFTMGAILNAFTTTVPLGAVKMAVTSADILLAVGWRWDGVKLGSFSSEPNH